MKILTIGDLHGSNKWKSIIEQEADRVIFIGDYLDSFTETGIQQLGNLNDIIEYKKNNMEKVVLLIGNHDSQYFPNMSAYHVSGYQQKMKWSFGSILAENRELFKMAHQEGNILFSHAGISHTWLKNSGWVDENIVDYVNDVWLYKPLMFVFNGSQPNGDDVGQTPIWIRPHSLKKDTANNLAKEYIQVFGHTYTPSIEIDDVFIQIDAIPANEYLIIEDSKFSVGLITH